MIYAYNGISKKKLDETHTVPNTKRSYTLRHNEKLVCDGYYKGKGQSGTTSQGWERNESKFFKELQQKHPEMFSRENTARIRDSKCPIVDGRMIKHSPELKPFKGDKLVHHHIGGDGQVVAAPESIHPGSGGIHNDEKAAGITQKCRDFSAECEKMLKKNPDMAGKSVKEYRAEMKKQAQAQQTAQGAAQKTAAAQKTTAAQKSTQQTAQQSAKSTAQSASRSSAARNSAASHNAAAAGNTRANAVRKQTASAQNASGASRAQAARSSTPSNTAAAAARQAAGQGQKRKR